jgi:hypothetical protein
MSVIQEGNIKHNYQAEIIKDEYVSILKTLYDLYYEKMDPKKQFTYGGKPAQIPFAAMKRNYRFALNGSTEIANKLIDRREKEELMKFLGGDPLMNPVKPREELLKAYGITETEEWINPQIGMVAKLILQNPEIPKVVGEYMQTKVKMAQIVNPQGNAGGENVIQGTGAA